MGCIFSLESSVYAVGYVVGAHTLGHPALMHNSRNQIMLVHRSMCRLFCAYLEFRLN